MALYLDTSLLVAALTKEPETKRSQAWLVSQDTEQLAISEWVAVEFSSALSIKMRNGQIEAGHRADALAMFARLREDSVALIAVTPAHFHITARFADQQAVGVRTGDALHLVICRGQGAVLCTLDRRLAQAGPSLGVQTRLI